MRKRLGSGSAADSVYAADARLPHPMLEPPRMIAPGQPNPASPSPQEREEP